MRRFKKGIGTVVAATMVLQCLCFHMPANVQTVSAAAVSQIPNTTRSFSGYSDSMMSLTGYASGNIDDRTEYVGTSYYRTVDDELEFLQALEDAKSGSVKVIEITEDMNLGYNEISTEAQQYVSKYADPYTSYTNPTLKETGASKVTISSVDGLTIFSKNGATIRHAEIKMNEGANDIVIRNLNFDDMWQWDDSGTHKEVGWAYIKVNGADNVWIDHCSFSLAADGLLDIENGSKNVTISWCTFGLETTENPGTDSMMYKTIMYMESLYQAGQCDTSGRYYKMRQAGSTPQMIMAYEAVHSKVHLLGGGDKDYKDDEIAGVENGNQNFRLTLAYNQYTNVMQRIPLVRQGSAHMINCEIDNSGHISYAQKYPTQTAAGNMNMTRAINARAGACIGADTCVFNYVNEPIIGCEKSCDDSFASPFDTLFSEMYNHVLIVNSKTTNTSGTTYTGSSWDNNGENLFTKGLTWYDKSTINNWAWSSEIVGVENYSKQNYPGKDGSAVEPFEIQYNYDEKLPYSYTCLPLSSVESTLDQYSGSGKISMDASEWLKISYRNASQSVDASEAVISVAKGGKEQITVGTSSELETFEMNLDTSSDYVLHVNAGYWDAYCNITCSNGVLSWDGTGQDIKDVVISGNNVKIYFADGVYANNVTNTSNATQMSYQGKISLHHNSGSNAINIVSYRVNNGELVQAEIVPYALSVAKGGKEQITVGTSNELETFEMNLDTSSDYVLHVNAGYWDAYCNITCSGGTLSWDGTGQDIKDVVISGNNVKIYFADGVYANNVTNTSNATQMSYQGKISLHHNSGSSAINVVSYRVNDGETVKGETVTYAMSIATGSKEQISVGTSKELSAFEMKLDTSNDFVLHFNAGYWDAYCNITCSGGTLSWDGTGQDIASVAINGNTVTIYFADGVYANNVTNTSNATQMSYQGKISLHHNSGSEAINVISYNISY